MGQFAVVIVAKVLAAQGRVGELEALVKEVVEKVPRDGAVCNPAPFGREISDAYEVEGYAYEARARLGD
jgi:hypothetical protein